jgi:hypothetical protein
LIVFDAEDATPVGGVAIDAVVGVLSTVEIAAAAHAEPSDLIASRRGRGTCVLGDAFGALEHAAARRSFAARAGRAVDVSAAFDATVKREIAARRAASAAVCVRATHDTAM